MSINKNNIMYCDLCRKKIGSKNQAWFSDRGKNLDFCSKTCQTQYRKLTNQNKPKSDNKEGNQSQPGIMTQIAEWGVGTVSSIGETISEELKNSNLDFDAAFEELRKGR